MKEKKRRVATTLVGGKVVLGLTENKSTNTTLRISTKKPKQKNNSENTDSDNDDKRDQMSANSSISVVNLTTPLTMECDALHDGRLILDAKVPIQVDMLFNMIFSKNAPFLTKFHEYRHSTDVQLGGWDDTDQNDQKFRTTSMVLELQANVGPKTVKVKEKQTLRACSKTGQLYAVDGVTGNEGIPYAETFTVNVHYCLSSGPNNSSQMLVLGKVEFVQSVWALVKTFIVKNSMESLIEFFEDMHKHLLAAYRPHSLK